jgi:hypothetical protein
MVAEVDPTVKCGEKLVVSTSTPRLQPARAVVDFGIQRWEVETDRGPRVFEVRSREDLRWLHPGHLIVRDIDGNRYEIKRFDDLDSASRIKIEGYL